MSGMGGKKKLTQIYGSRVSQNASIMREPRDTMESYNLYATEKSMKSLGEAS